LEEALLMKDAVEQSMETLKESFNKLKAKLQEGY